MKTKLLRKLRKEVSDIFVGTSYRGIIACFHKASTEELINHFKS